MQLSRWPQGASSVRPAGLRLNQPTSATRRWHSDQGISPALHESFSFWIIGSETTPVVGLRTLARGRNMFRSVRSPRAPQRTSAQTTTLCQFDGTCATSRVGKRHSPAIKHIYCGGFYSSIDLELTERAQGDEEFRSSTAIPRFNPDTPAVDARGGSNARNSLRTGRSTEREKPFPRSS